MLGAAAGGLDGAPHVLALRKEIPAGLREVVGGEAASLIERLGLALDAVLEDLGPGEVSVAADDGVGGAVGEGLVGVERGVDAAEDDPGAALAGDAADFVAAERVEGVDADADDVTGLDGLWVDLLEGLVDEFRVAEAFRGGAGEDKHPPWSDDCNAEGAFAGVHKLNCQDGSHSRGDWLHFVRCIRTENDIPFSVGMRNGRNADSVLCDTKAGERIGDSGAE